MAKSTESTEMKALYEPFPPEMERTLTKGGAALTYIPVSEVINRLNKVIGLDKWSFAINYCERDKADTDFIVAHVTFTATFGTGEDERKISRDGIGGQKIKRTRAGDIVDLGDEMKGAVSDALKKAAQTLGIGLYLARSEEAMEVEVASEIPQVSPEIETLWNNFVGLSKSLNATAKGTLNDHWVEFSGGRPKPTKTTATVQDLEALIAKCVELKFTDTDSGKND